MFIIFSIFVLIYSVIIHEYAHGWMADRLGDPTARHAGRLTLNPMPHIDPIGSILIPGFLIMSGANFLIGWAKPVPFNPYNLKDQKHGSAKVAIAGPASNFLIALTFGLILRFFPVEMLSNYNVAVFAQLLSYVVWLNLLLMIFNLIPIPPLDGSKVLMTILPSHYQEIFHRLEQWGMFILIFFIFVLFPYVVLPILSFLFKLIVGAPFYFFL
jgi:Zn-dependent protease